MNQNRFNVEESAILLHAVFPKYPDLRGMNPVPEVRAFLLSLRSARAPGLETSGPLNTAWPSGRNGEPIPRRPDPTQRAAE